MDRSVLLSRRVPREQVIPGRAYLISARNGCVGVAVTECDQLGYTLRRVKFDRVFLFTEVDWEEDENYGTAIPLRLLDEEPPTEEEELLAWLFERERECLPELRDQHRELGCWAPD